MRTRAAVVLLATAVGLTGCSAVGGSDNPTFVPTDEATSSSAPSEPTSSPTQTQAPAQDLFVMPEGSQWLDTTSVPARFAVPSNWEIIDNLAISRGQAQIPQQYAEALAEQKKQPAAEVAAQLKNGILINAMSLGGDDQGSVLAVTYSGTQETVTRADVDKVMASLKATSPKINPTQTPLGPAFRAVFTRKVSASATAAGQLLVAQTDKGVVVFLLQAPDAKTAQSVMSVLATSLSQPL